MLFHCAISLCSHAVLSRCALSLCSLTVLSHCTLSLYSVGVLSDFVVRLSPGEMANKEVYDKMEVVVRPYELAPFVPGV